MRRRQGFTIVEMLVAMALIMFIMAILSQAFVSGIGAFRVLKASGDMAEKLRATTQLLQRDLAADHFEGKKRLSNPNFWLNGPPQQGYFQIWQANGGNPEGLDFDGVTSFRTTAPGHTLAFTIKMRGNQMGDFLSASGPLSGVASFGPAESRYQNTSGGSYNYQWAEVAWFLQPQPDTTVADAATPAVPLFTLFRRQRLAVPDNSLVPQLSYTNQPSYINQYANPLNPLLSCLELSCWGNPAPPQPPPSPPTVVSPGSLYFNSPIDLTVPQRRFGGGNPLNFMSLAAELGNLGVSNPTLAGSDIQLNDVVSFDVRMLVPDIANEINALSLRGFQDPFVTMFTTYLPPTPASPPPPPANTNVFTYPVNYVTNPAYNPATGGPMVFDTWSSVNDSLNGPLGYQQWNLPPNQQTPPNQGTTIPLWSGTKGPIIQAIQIQIRIWDAKTNQTRQVTIVQAM
jgi:prepilin-type N-terminal cleavage/methylation domain-containing protein